MIVKQVYKIDHKSQLLINIPENFRDKRQILVVLDDSVNSKADKIALMKIASSDPVFLEDIESISRDFSHN